MAVGSRIGCKVRGRDPIWRVTAYEPYVMCEYETDYWYAQAHVVYRVEPTPNGARFVIEDKARWPGLLCLLEPLLNWIDIRYRNQ